MVVPEILWLVNPCRVPSDATPLRQSSAREALKITDDQYNAGDTSSDIMAGPNSGSAHRPSQWLSSAWS
jgi:hypothetical protein